MRAVRSSLSSATLWCLMQFIGFPITAVYGMDMNLRQIEVFSAIMRTGSVTAAARELNVSQPSISKTLRHAESQIGVELFQRIKGRLYPTPEAEILYDETLRIDEDVKELRRLVVGLREVRVGIVRVACPPALSSYILPRAVGVFRSRHPRIGLRIEVSRNNAIADLVNARRVDVGVVHFPTEDAQLEANIIAIGRLVCVVNRRHPLAAKKCIRASDLKGVEIIRCSVHAQLQRAVRSFLEIEDEAADRIEVNHFPVAIRLVSLGLGAAIVDEFATFGEYPPEVAVLPLEPEIPIAVGAIYPRYRPISQAAARFVDCVSHVLVDFKSQKGLSLPKT